MQCGGAIRKRSFIENLDACREFDVRRLEVFGSSGSARPRDKITALVEEKGWTQVDAANRCGVTQPRMNDLLRDEFRVSRLMRW